MIIIAEVIHTINGKQYLYDHQRVGDKVVSTYLYPVDDEGKKLNKRRAYIKQHSRGVNKTDFKKVSDKQFNDDKVKLANETIKTENMASYDVIGKKNGETIVIAKDVKDYNEAQNIASANYPYQTDKLREKYGHIDKGDIRILTNSSKKVIVNQSEINEILDSKDQETFYKKIVPKYTPKKEAWKDNFKNIMQKNQPKIFKNPMVETKPFNTKNVNDLKLGSILYETKEYKTKDGKKEKRFNPVVVTGFDNTDFNTMDAKYKEGSSIRVMDYYNTEEPNNSYSTGRLLNSKNVRVLK